ncbi:MAG: NAD(P)-dependent oxidoreductase [Candidatus Cloacimonadota bacterium]|nr:NAD(P)-dependent oxidoreductase [Candidatus Cloacimonadota bacterium]
MKTLVIEKMPTLFWKLAKKYEIESCFEYQNYDNKEDIKIIILRTHVFADKKLIDLFPNLVLIIRAGSGFDNIDVNYAISKNIKVCNTPNANVQSAFEHTLGLIFSLIKQYKINENNMKLGFWKKNLQYNLEIADLKLLVVGVGRIGTKVAQTMQNLGAEVRGVDPFLHKSEFDDKNIKSTDYEDGIKWCNMISYHCPLTSKTFNYFDDKALKLIKKPIFILNVARGKILDFEIINDALNNGKIAGIAIDVFPEEPTIIDENLNRVNSIYSPHVGAFTQNAKDRMAKETIDVWENFVLKNRVISEVDLRFILPFSKNG